MITFNPLYPIVQQFGKIIEQNILFKCLLYNDSIFFFIYTYIQQRVQKE